MFAPECAGFLPFTPQLLEKRFWMFGASQVCLGVTHRRSHPHSRVILQGARKEERCKDKGGKGAPFGLPEKQPAPSSPGTRLGTHGRESLCHLSPGRRQPGLQLEAAGLAGRYTTLLAGSCPFHITQGSILTIIYFIQYGSEAILSCLTKHSSEDGTKKHIRACMPSS